MAKFSIIEVLKDILSTGATETTLGEVETAINDLKTETSWIDRSGTITTGGASQILMPANLQRRGFFVQNLSTEDLWILDNASATTGQPSLRIPQNSSFTTPFTVTPSTSINIIGATTGSAFSAREW